MPNAVIQVFIGEAERSHWGGTSDGGLPVAARITDGAGGVTDEARANATQRYTEHELVMLTTLIALNVITRLPADDYQVGQFG